VPPFDLNKDQKFVVHSQSSLSLSNTIAIEKFINEAIENKRLLAQGINPVVFKNINADAEIENSIDSKDGSKKANAGVAYAVSFACGILIYMMMIIYGTQVNAGRYGRKDQPYC
jgi:ABC-2 type transport system permease protein